MAKPQSIPERFWSKVGPPDENGCRRWLACAVDRRGYGSFWDGERPARAHAFAWRLTYHGPTKPGAEVFRHSCDHPWCCEPSHIYPGTVAENQTDMKTKGRMPSGEMHHARLRPERMARGNRHGSRTHPERIARGERNGFAKLTARAVAEMRGLFGTVPVREIARRYDVHEATVFRIKRGDCWKTGEV